MQSCFFIFADQSNICMLDNRGVKFGLYAGIAVVLLFFGVYLIDKEWFFNPFLFWASVGIYLAFGWKLLEDERQAAGGKLPFQDGLRTVFMMFVVANLIYYAFHYSLYNFIDRDLVQLQKEVIAKTLEQWKDSMPVEQYRERKTSLENDSMAMTLSNTALQYAWGLVGYFVLSLIMAGVVSRR
jgi:hypothetical protein